MRHYCIDVIRKNKLLEEYFGGEKMRADQYCRIEIYHIRKVLLLNENNN
jgi:hypothetical protein